MDNEIERLEQQIEHLIELYESGRAEARELRARVTALEAENRSLSGKVSLAAERLEALLDKLPES